MITSSGDGESGDLDCWADIERSIYVLGRSLLLNDVHYMIPAGCAEVWIIRGKAIAPEKGILTASPPPRHMVEEIALQRDDFERTTAEIIFDIEGGDSSGSGEMKEGKLLYVIFGELFFGVVNGRLVFRGKDYGEIEAGDTVKVDKSRNVTVTKKTEVEHPSKSKGVRGQ